MRKRELRDNISKRIMPRTLLTVLLIIVVILAYNIQPVKAEPRDIIATYGQGYLENINGLLVLHVKGSPYEMGYQQGFLLKDRIQALTQYLIQHMISMGYCYEYTVNCTQAMEPHIPQEYIEEMEGLADGASMNYTDVLIAQLASRIEYYGHGWMGCSGFVVFGNATSDGHLYHGRSLDHSVCTAGSVGLVTVYEPENGNTFVNVGQIGMIGVSTGMNTEGITVELNLSYSTNRTLDGMPVSFMLRKVLQYSNNLTHAIDTISQTDRTQGYNILLGDGRNLKGVAVEVSKNYCKVFWAGDPAENITPHYLIPNTVRRTNHYVDPELAATQRSTYDPRLWGPNSWDRYELLSQLIEGNYGNIDAQMSIEFLRTPPVAWAAINLQSVVFDSTNLELWVADSAFSIPAYQREFIHLSYDDLFPGYPVYPTVTTQAATSVLAQSATLNMNYTVGNFSPVQVRFAYMIGSHWSYTDWVSKGADGTYTTLVELPPSADVDFKAQLNFEDTIIDGDTLQFTTLAAPLCFIATAAYGAPMDEDVQILREFRDKYLLTNPLGLAFVDFYYRVSPPIAEFITEHSILKPIVRAALIPAVVMSTVAVNTTPTEKTAIIGLLVLFSVALAVWATRRRGRGSEHTQS